MPDVTLATCIGCGCTDERACEGGCFWLRLDRIVGLGVCSECADHEDRWDAGDRSCWFGEPNDDDSDLLLAAEASYEDYELVLDLLDQPLTFAGSDQWADS